MTDKFVNLNNARPGKYEAEIKKILDAGVCPFCVKHLRTYHKKPIEEKKFWWLTDNDYPYELSQNHILIIHKEHIEMPEEMKLEAAKELWEIIAKVTKKRNIAGGTFFMRFAETKFTGAAVVHLHAHIIQSNPDDPNYDPKIGLMARVG